MADPLAQARHDLAVANRVVSYEGIIDAFGHVSMRHPTKPDRYLVSRSRSPEVVEASDIYEYTLDSEPVTPLPPGIRGYGELVIHGEIYKARPDVNAVAHHHAMAFLPFCNSGEELLPLYHMGAQIGEKVPFWDCATSSATPISWCSSRRKAARSPSFLSGQPRRIRRHQPPGAQARGAARSPRRSARTGSF